MMYVNVRSKRKAVSRIRRRNPSQKEEMTNGLVYLARRSLRRYKSILCKEANKIVGNTGFCLKKVTKKLLAFIREKEDSGERAEMLKMLTEVVKCVIRRRKKFLI